MVIDGGRGRPKGRGGGQCPAPTAGWEPGDGSHAAAVSTARSGARIRASRRCLAQGPARPEGQRRPDRAPPARGRRAAGAEGSPAATENRPPPPGARRLVQPARAASLPRRDSASVRLSSTARAVRLADRARRHQRAGHLADPAHGRLGRGLRETAAAGRQRPHRGPGPQRPPAGPARRPARPASAGPPRLRCVRSATVRSTTGTSTTGTSRTDGDARSGPDRRAADRTGGSSGASSGRERRTAERTAGGSLDGAGPARPAGRPARGAARTRPSAAGRFRPVPLASSRPPPPGCGCLRDQPECLPARPTGVPACATNWSACLRDQPSAGPRDQPGAATRHSTVSTIYLDLRVPPAAASRPAARSPSPGWTGR